MTNFLPRLINDMPIMSNITRTEKLGPPSQIYNFNDRVNTITAACANNPTIATLNYRL